LPEFTHLTVLPEGATTLAEARPLDGAITFWHLLTHMSGLGYGFADQVPEPVEVLYRAARIVSPLALVQDPLPTFSARVAALPLACPLGTGWHYSVAHDLLGYLIERVSGQSLATFLRERIFAPLGMPDTAFSVPPEKRDRFGPLYRATSPYTRSDVVPSGAWGSSPPCWTTPGSWRCWRKAAASPGCACSPRPPSRR
jgi:CubicO group peptidase (beta-lactamase class C family)